MSERQRDSAGRWDSVRAGLDMAATAAMLFAAGVVVWAVMRTPTSLATAIPSEPVSIDGAPKLGVDAANVVAIEFSDFECPYCSQFAREILPGVKAKYIDTGLVQLAFRYMPLTEVHPRAFRAAEAAACAARQGHFWAFHDRLFADVRGLDPEAMRQSAKALGLNISVFDICMNGDSEQRVRSDVAMAQALGVRGTPTLMIGTREGPGLVRVRQVARGVASPEGLTRELDGLLRAAVE
jgi:protein-disulfide isomerase